MQQLTLIKSHPCIQLGHLYEHLYMRQLNEFFYSKGLFKYTDYAAQGTTYDQGGAIVVEISLYTKATQQLAAKLADIQVPCTAGSPAILLALDQMIAEEAYQLHFSSTQSLVRGLQEISALPWQSIDEFDILDTTSVRRKGTPIRLTSTPSRRPRTLHVSLELDTKFGADNRQLAPLFNIVARTFLHTIGFKLVSTLGCYSDSLHGQIRPLRVHHELLVAPHIKDTVNLSTVVDLSQEVIRHMVTNGVLERTASDLQTIDYSHRSHTAPDYEKLLHETGVLIGTQGWQTIATIDTIRRILEHMTLEVKYGRLKRSVRLNDEIKRSTAF